MSQTSDPFPCPQYDKCRLDQVESLPLPPHVVFQAAYRYETLFIYYTEEKTRLLGGQDRK